jgi:hypothetical protein
MVMQTLHRAFGAIAAVVSNAGGGRCLSRDSSSASTVVCGATVIVILNPAAGRHRSKHLPA